MSCLPPIRRRGAAALLLAALLLSGCAGLVPASHELPAPVRAALQRAGLPEQSLGVVAFPLEAPRQGLRWRADAAMQTGSTMKLVTAIVALDKLGPNQRGRTELLAAAVPQGGVLQGPLYLRGGADPELDWAALWGLLRELREQGLRELRGGIVVDRTRFQPARPELGQPPFDEQPEFPYNVIPDALHLNGSLLDLELQSDGERMQARLSPAWPGLSVDATGLTLNELACKDWEEGWQIPVVEAGQLRLRGSFPRQCRQRQALNVFDRQLLAGAALRALWQELGGALQGEVGEGATPVEARVLASHQGRPLGELLRGVMKRSDNALTRLTFLNLGAAHPRAASFARTQEAAADQVRQWLAEHGVAAPELVLENGSGLSRAERISPASLAAMLAAAWQGPYAPELLSSLPLAGVDGTLGRRLKGTPAEARARLKTGTLRNVVGLAGYVHDGRGRPWVMVALLNHDEAPAKGRPVLDALAAWLAQY
ncbi:D-alanyl-D-alanine carboxypeptidase/D-alanyl-D-alanine-endopeptidase [Paucibacter sediminis]|uniref:D-alanyl-D-alanine carboxypeptidase/D-alanyl-D-alanine-endopeptidase n=1 Tax=Paucibacter sediminis TaxID=3019553 RepID=A0AA95SRT4_9BURK|nr:D-alanyl-D-alanine carboxypeptidase/D-alanyl-D-alanine-endopeptidase [Paucibacter sp. S2-9]WIT13626.1 D-alanyl-D-alanine carboxypeptidase/D-alanyl-D-alanine-endopeptidase [Paucibacter sp. S2-9]